VHVLVVCTANIARSPLAAALLARELGDEVVVGSAGTRARPGYEAAPESLRLARERGLDLTDHRSRLVSPDLLTPAELILTMSERQRDAVTPQAPRLAGRVFTLREFDRLTAVVDADAGPEGTVPERLAWWREQAHLARPAAPRASEAEDVRDPMGRSPETWLRTGGLLDELTTRIGGRIRG
jgi:protein-tyrosine-phosphatase